MADAPNSRMPAGLAGLLSVILHTLKLSWLYVLTALVLFAGLAVIGLFGLWYAQHYLVIATPIPTRMVSNARISVEPSSGAPGLPLRVTGRDWQAGDVVFVSLEAPFSASHRDSAYAGAVVDKKGEFQVSFVFPQEERWAHSGAIKVVAWAEQSGSKAVTIFQVVGSTPTPFRVLINPALPTTVSKTAEAAQAAPAQMTQPTPVVIPTSTPFPVLPADNWYGEYFSNPMLSASPAFLRNDPEIRFDWGEGSPGSKLNSDGFSVRWTRDVYFVAGVYRFFAQADDGVRLWVDDKLAIDQWHEGSTTTYVADTYLWDGEHRLRLEYYELGGKASVRLWWEKLEVFPDWKGEYFNNSSLAGQPVLVRNDAYVRFNWGSQPPAQGIRADSFSARWTRRARLEQGRTRFYIHADDGMRVWLDNTLLIDLWQSAGSGLRTMDLSLEAGEYRIQVEYYNASGEARAEIWWETLAATPTAVPSGPPGIPMAAVATPTVEMPPVVKAQLAVPSRSVEAELALENATEEMAVAFPPAPVASAEPLSGAPESVAATPFMALATAPLLEVTPLEAALGSEVVVSGRGWRPGEEVVIALVEPGAELAQAPPLAHTFVDEEGRFETRFLLPDEPNWQDDSELIVLAHTLDWTTRVVSPLYVIPPKPTGDSPPLAQP